MTATTFQVEIAREAVEECAAAVENGEPGAQADLERAQALLEKYLGGVVIEDTKNVAAEHDPNRKRPEGGKIHRNQYGVCRVRTVSDKQARFIQNLIDTRVIPATGGEQVALAAFRQGTLNLRHASDLIEWLLLLPKNEKADQPRLASEKALGFLRSLVESQNVAALSEADQAKVEHVRNGAHPTAKDTSDLIDALKRVGKKPVEMVQHRSGKMVAKSEVEDGIYRKDDVVYKVQYNLAGTNLYAKRLVLDEEGNGSWEYAGGVRKVGLTPEHKMTLEQAKEFGALYGTCVACGRRLTNEESIEAGIGPVCASKF